jgi:hypothetical protein
MHPVAAFMRAAQLMLYTLGFFFFACERPLECVTFAKRNFKLQTLQEDGFSCGMLVDNSHNHFIAYLCCQSPPRSR